MSKGKATPIEVKELAGTVNVTREREKAEVRYESVDGKFLPDPPEDLGERGKELWSRIAAQLASVGIMFLSNLEYLEAYCRALEVREIAWEELKRSGMYDEDAKGNRRLSQAYKAYNDQVTQMIALGAKLGLSPVDKTKVSQSIAGGKNAGKNDIKRIGVNG